MNNPDRYWDNLDDNEYVFRKEAERNESDSPGVGPSIVLGSHVRMYVSGFNAISPIMVVARDSGPNGDGSRQRGEFNIDNAKRLVLQMMQRLWPVKILVLLGDRVTGERWVVSADDFLAKLRNWKMPGTGQDIYSYNPKR